MSTNDLSLSRLETLCDGVFAIAMTLLILEVHVPVKQLIHSEKDLFNAIWMLGPKLFSYFISFLILGIFWVAHHGQFAFIKSTNRELLWINVLLLSFISLLPFSAALLGEYIRYKTAVWIYWLNLVFIGYALILNWRYAKRHGFIPALKSNPEVDRIVQRRILRAQVLYALGAIAAFVSTYLSLAFFLGTQITYVFPRLFDKKAHDLFKERTVSDY